MIYPITVFGDPILRKVTADIDQNYEGLKKLVDDMFETMHNADGVGMAAPQIGLTERIFVVDLAPLGEDEPLLKDFKKASIRIEIAIKLPTHIPFIKLLISLPSSISTSAAVCHCNKFFLLITILYIVLKMAFNIR